MTHKKDIILEYMKSVEIFIDLALMKISNLEVF